MILAKNERMVAAVESRYMKAAQVAEMLQVSPQTVRRWASDGKIKSLQVGAGGYGSSMLRFERADVEAFIKRCTVKAKEPR